MSNNIDHSEYKSGKLYIKARDAMKLERNDEKRVLPEGNIFGDDLFRKLLAKAQDDDLVPIDNFWWYGECSGYAYHESLEWFLALTTGEAVIFFIWEGSGYISAIKVKDGVIRKAKVRIEVDDA